MLLPIYHSAVRQFDTRIRAVRDEQWALSTPDTEWDTYRLVRHVIVGQAAVPLVLAAGDGALSGLDDSAVSEDFFDGALPAGPVDIGDDATGPDLVQCWATTSAAAVQALTGNSTSERRVQLPDGPATVSELGWRLAADLTVHAWDLARAIDAPDGFPNDLLAHVLDQLQESHGRWLPADRYAPSIPVPGCTDDLTELLALTGRNRWWRRTHAASAPSQPA